MRADNSAHIIIIIIIIIAAARRRSDDARRRAVTALRRLEADGQPVNVSTVASAAGVSRSWLYAQDDLREQIGRLRTRQQQTPSSPTVPDRQRATPVSLLRRLEAATTRIRVLEAENRQLRAALERSLGEQRAASIRSPAPTRPESSRQEEPGRPPMELRERP